MDAKKLVELRRQAEKAVADMPDGELKVKAFEVMLAHLMGGLEVAPGRLTETQNEPKAKARKEGTPARSIGGRILVLQDEGFFKNQKTIGEVREELRAHGWHYPLTTLSGRLQALVQQRKLEEKEPSRAKKDLEILKPLSTTHAHLIGRRLRRRDPRICEDRADCEEKQVQSSLTPILFSQSSGGSSRFAQELHYDETRLSR